MFTRQPVKVRRGRSARDVFTGLAALATLVTLIVGVPYALIAFFGSPIPDEVPRLDSLTAELGPGTLLDVLVVLVWLAWAQLTVCVIVEVYAGIRGIGLPARVPLSGGSQALAHRLVVAALLLFAASTAIMPATGGGKVAELPRPAQTQSQPVQQLPASPQEAAVQITDDIGAEPVHKEKEKIRKIYRVQPPHGRHHESLWEIADKCLGDGRRYKEIYSLNKGKQQPDGSRLTIASLIRPGWILEMPDDAVGVENVPEPGRSPSRGHGKQDRPGTDREQAPDAGRESAAKPGEDKAAKPGEDKSAEDAGPGAARSAQPAQPGQQPGALLPPGGVPGAAQSATPRPEPKGPYPPSPEASRPDVSRPDVSRPEAARPDVSQPGTPWPDLSRPDLSRPDAARPDVSQPGTPRPDVSRPEPKGPYPSSPEASRAEASRPEASRPDASRPGTPRPETPPPGAARPAVPPAEPSPETPKAAAPGPKAPGQDARPRVPEAERGQESAEPAPGSAGAAPVLPAPSPPPPGTGHGSPGGPAADAGSAPGRAAPSGAAPSGAAPSGAAPGGEAPDAAPERSAEQPPGAQPGGPAAPPESAGQPVPQPSASPPAAPRQPVPAPAAETAPADGGEEAQGPVERATDWSHGIALASLLAAGLLAALGRRRREQLWNRAFGQRVRTPDGDADAARAEQALRIGSDSEATRLLDLGLRYMSKALAAEGRTPPTVYGVHLSPAGVDLWIAPADRRPPAPWEQYDNGQVWRLSAASLEGLAAREFADVLAPYPGLVSIGTNDTGRILVDLEAAHGLVALRGPDEPRRAALAALALELATNRWSDHMRVTLVGFGEELSLVAPDRIRVVDSLADALPELEARAEEVRQALSASGADSVLTGRCRGVFGEAWMPHYLIMADPPSEDEADRLVTLARTGQRMAAGFLVAGDVPDATWTWDVTATGRLRAGVLGFDVDAQLVPERHYRAVVELFRTAGRVEGVPLPVLGPDDEPPYAGAAGRHSVDVRLLGPVEVEASGPIEESRRALCTEVLVYLATHPQGVPPNVLASAVWPRGVSASVRDSTVARVADWLGRDSRGRQNLYYDERGRIRLGSEVRVDWEMFRWLIWRSAAEPASEVAYMAYALDLIRGSMLAGRPRGRYAWLALENLEYEADARVSDVAHRLVMMRLDNWELQAAVHAAKAGLRFNPDDEVLWRDLLRATHAIGDQRGLRTVISDLRFRVESDPVMDQLQPETEALIDELLPEWRHEPGRYGGPYGQPLPGMPGRGVAAGGG